MYTTLKIISRKFLGVSLIWTFFSHGGAIFFETALYVHNHNYNKTFLSTGIKQSAQILQIMSGVFDWSMAVM